MSLANTVLTKDDMINKRIDLQKKFWGCLDELYKHILSTGEFADLETLTRLIGCEIDEQISLAKHYVGKFTKEMNESFELRDRMTAAREKLISTIKDMHKTLPDSWAVQLRELENEIKELDEALKREHNLYPCDPWRGFWEEVIPEVQYD